MHVDASGERRDRGVEERGRVKKETRGHYKSGSAPGNMGGDEDRRREISQPGDQGRLLGGGDSGGEEKKQGKSIMSKGKNRNKGEGLRTSLLRLGMVVSLVQYLG